MRKKKKRRNPKERPTQDLQNRGAPRREAPTRASSTREQQHTPAHTRRKPQVFFRRVVCGVCVRVFGPSFYFPYTRFPPRSFFCPLCAAASFFGAFFWSTSSIPLVLPQGGKRPARGRASIMPRSERISPRPRCPPLYHAARFPHEKPAAATSPSENKKSPPSSSNDDDSDAGFFVFGGHRTPRYHSRGLSRENAARKTNKK